MPHLNKLMEIEKSKTDVQGATFGNFDVAVYTLTGKAREFFGAEIWCPCVLRLIVVLNFRQM